MSAVVRAHGRVPDVVALSVLLAGTLLMARPCAFALDPSLDISQYAHTAWRIREGFSKGTISSIAQTPDGYLWLGTEFGLLRFDGVRTVPWQPPADQHLPSGYISKLIVTRDGTLWIGTDKGLASWKDSRLTLYPQLSGQIIGRLLEDHEGSVWAGTWTFPPPGKLCAIHSGSFQCFGQDGSLGYGVLGLFEDRKGNLWAGVQNGLWRRRPVPPKFYPVPDASDVIRAFADGDDGALLIGTRTGIKRVVDGKTEAYLLPGTVQRFDAETMLRDRNGGLWIGSRDSGLVHVHQGRTDVFARSDGLSSETVVTIFEDREGDIWVATDEGLDRFREFAVATFSAKQGLSDSRVASVLADRDGSVWVATAGGLNRWQNGRFTIPQTGAAKRDGKLNGLAPRALFQDAHERIWVSTAHGVGYLENDRFILSSVRVRNVLSFAQETGGNLSMFDLDLGLFRLSAQSEVQQIPWDKLGHKDFASALAADPSRGGLWLGFYKGDVAYFSDGGVRTSYSAADGLGEGRINSLRFDRDGTLWAATEGGLSRLKSGRLATLNTKNGLPCDTVHWTVEDDAHSFWLYAPCGLLRIARPQLDAWVGDSKQSIQATVFDSSDGVRSRASVGSLGPLAAKSPDGKLWFVSSDGVSVVDPRHLPFNNLPPPVHIEQVIADHKSYPPTSEKSGRVPLPALVRDLQIAYTALSLVAPEKVLFRYKLEGWDRDWQDVGTRRQAFYTNLPPRNYRFRVIACNNSGVWNESGTSLDFSVAPAYYQTWWFRSLCVTVFLALLVVLYRLRLHQVERQFNLRLEGRVAERTRIARELHDTLLQSFQGTLLKFHALTYMLLDRPEVQKRLETAIEQARQAVTEGRDAVQGMRSSTLVSNDLARALVVLGEDLAAEHGNGKAPKVCVQVQGTTRDLAPIVRDDVYRIASEALRNAFRHAHASRIEVEIRYDPRQFQLRVRDDGKGIDPKVLDGDGGGRAGHYGMPGMHERAKLVGGKLAVWSEHDSGTEVGLTIPASIAYAKSIAARRQLFWKRGA